MSAVERVVIGLLVAVAVLFGIGGMWFWAIFGMSEAVGTACGFTALVALSLAFSQAVG